jgi:hypothetical protein
MKIVQSSAKIEKLRKLVEKINRMDRYMPKTKVLMNKLRLEGRRLADISYLIEGYELEISRMNLLVADDSRRFHEEEAKLLLQLAAEERRWDQFVENRLRGQSEVDALWNRLEDLSKLERDMRGNNTVRKYQEAMEKWRSLVSQMSADDVNNAIGGQDVEA